MVVGTKMPPFLAAKVCFRMHSIKLDREPPDTFNPSWVMFWWGILGLKRYCWSQILSVALLSEDFMSCSRARSPCNQRFSPGFGKVLSQDKNVLTQYHDDTDYPGELPYKKDGGARGKFWKLLLRDTKILFCGRGLKFFFTPKRYRFVHNTLSSVIFFQLNTLKDIAKAPAVDLLGLTTLKRYQNCYFNP